MTTFFLPRVAGGLLLAALVLGTLGCKGEKPKATVSGTVKYNNKPQTVGTVNFLSAAGAGAQAQLDENGGFKVDTPIEAGEFKVYLNPPTPGQNAPGTKAPPPTKYNVSPKFQDPGTSGVTVNLKEGPNEGITIEFKD